MFEGERSGHDGAPTHPVEAPARACLRRPFHLACISGPDRGALVPLPGLLGREAAGLADPGCSREHARLEVEDGRVVLEDLGSLNGTYLDNRHPFSRIVPGRKVRLHPGARIRVGADLFELRTRPMRLDVPAPIGARAVLLAAPFVSLLLFTGVRALSALIPSSSRSIAVGLLPVLVVLLVAGFVLRRRVKAARAARDCPLLALRLASLAASADAGPSMSGGRGTPTPALPDPPSVLGARAPRLLLPSELRPRTLDLAGLGPGRTIGCIGPGADSAAAWIASALVVRLGGGRIHLADGTRLRFGEGSTLIRIVAGDTRPGGCAEDEDGAPAFRIGIATTLDSLPTWCETLVHAPTQVLTPSWWERLGARDVADALPSEVGLEPLLAAALPPAAPFSSLAVPVGVHAGGPFVLDLVADGPHALVAGSTGSGKSEALLTWLRALCATRGPDELRLVLIDYKGGATFAPLADEPCVEAVFTDLAEGATSRALRAVRALLRRREEELAACGHADYSSWARAFSAGEGEPPPPRIVVAIDEFAVLAESHGSGLDILARIAAQGRSLGFHLIAATQRPVGAVSAAMRANLDLRIGLRCLEESDSVDLLGDASAAHLPRIPGRAVVAGHGTIHFARSSSRPSAPARRASARPLPWAPLAPMCPTWAQIEAAPACESGDSRDEVGVRLALVDGIEEGAHLGLVWHGGALGVRAPHSQASAVESVARILGERIGASAHRGVHVCGPGGEIGPDEGADLALLFEELRSAGPIVLVIADAPRARRALAREFGPVLGEEMWSRGLDGAVEAGAILVLGAAGARAEDPDLRRCVFVFERPDPLDPLESGRVHFERPEGGGQWLVRGAGPTARLCAIPADEDCGAGRAIAPLIVPWAAVDRPGVQPRLLVGPRWEPLSIDSRCRWVLLGDAEGLGEAAIRASVRGDARRGLEIDSIPSESWTRLLREEGANILALETPEEVLRGLARLSGPPSASLFRRFGPPRTGIARVDGRWVRAGVTEPIP